VAEAARIAAAEYCQYADACCGDYVYMPRERPDDCEEAVVGPLLDEFVRAAADAGAEVDPSAYLDGPDILRCPQIGIDKGQDVRLETIDGILLPYFHGTRRLGEPCFTRWDCEQQARCDGLGDDGDVPGTCGIRPTVGGPCAEIEPYCPVGTACTVLEDRTVCERRLGPREECVVFEHAGRTTDNCDADHWCDVELGVCRPVLWPGDPCHEDRQCGAFDCGGTCPSVVAGSEVADDLMGGWCEETIPGARRFPD
jgi:hypothetical protein